MPRVSDKQGQKFEVRSDKKLSENLYYKNT